ELIFGSTLDFIGAPPAPCEALPCPSSHWPGWLGIIGQNDPMVLFLDRSRRDSTDGLEGVVAVVISDRDDLSFAERKEDTDRGAKRSASLERAKARSKHAGPLELRGNLIALG